MGRRGPKPRHQADDLLNAAMSLIDEGGLEGLSMSGLARCLGTSVSGLYRYFPNLEAVKRALQERAIQAYTAGLRAELERVNQAVSVRQEKGVVVSLVRVIAAFSYYRRHAVERPAEHRLFDVFLSAPRPVLSDEQARAVDERLSELVGICAEVLDGASAAGALDSGDSMQRTYVLWAALHGLEHFRKRDRILPVPLQVQALERVLMRTMLIGFGATEEALQRAWTHPLLDPTAG